MYTVFADWATSHGADALYLGVPEQHIQAYHFWQRMGFEANKQAPSINTQREHRLMRKEL
ncbi:hypothetical protein KDA_62270 [Dictyobacter alpinus]|uniref:N-acetyltransferase domain-containing protein n=1 Tax=Dictyobacter alpinus TaxID=2014873 RepID=A0A402BH88_9CHLR|nr:hypothetical protein KDA_62270 [Dictyobacter alpinus]